MIYHVNSPYYRQFLSNGPKYWKYNIKVFLIYGERILGIDII